MKTYGHIIIGCGASGLSLAYHLSNAGFPGGSILLIDKENKIVNDNSWGYWSRSAQPFDSIAKRSFKKIGTNHPGHQIIYDLKRYKFHVLQRTDFEVFVKNHLAQFKEVDWLTTNIESVKEEKDHVVVQTSKGTFQSDYVFSSIYSEQDIVERSRLFIRQQIKGWIIQTATNSFNPDSMTLFDFNTPQCNQMRYMSVIPENENRATIKFNVFAEKLLEKEEYENSLRNYIQHHLKIKEYTIEAEEWGVIPMTDHYFATRHGNRIIKIGIAGGCTKASSGYSFKRIQRHTQLLAQLLKDGWPPYADANSGPRFRFYDQVLLNIFIKNAGAGAKIFSDLFSRNEPEKVFKFLDEDTLLTEDLKIISSLSSFPFLRSVVTLAGSEVNPLIMVKNAKNKDNNEKSTDNYD
ncbi:MAG: lycopene cyclase family protein [Bacteroidota bacterium]|nr:lycopene cyclase family protein [Bacteroidota bacterium]